MQPNKLYVTPAGLTKLESDLAYWRDEKLPSIREQLFAVAGGADWMEDAEYVRLLNEVSFVEGRIEELEDNLRRARLIGKATQKDIVELGETVVLEDCDEQAVVRYTIVGSTEADPEQGLISNESPLGRALLSQHVGARISVQTPGGMRCFNLLAVEESATRAAAVA